MGLPAAEAFLLNYLVLRNEFTDLAIYFKEFQAIKGVQIISDPEVRSRPHRHIPVSPVAQRRESCCPKDIYRNKELVGTEELSRLFDKWMAVVNRLACPAVICFRFWGGMYTYWCSLWKGFQCLRRLSHLANLLPGWGTVEGWIFFSGFFRDF